MSDDCVEKVLSIYFYRNQLRETVIFFPFRLHDASTSCCSTVQLSAQSHCLSNCFLFTWWHRFSSGMNSPPNASAIPNRQSRILPADRRFETVPWITLCNRTEIVSLVLNVAWSILCPGTKHRISAKQALAQHIWLQRQAASKTVIDWNCRRGVESIWCTWGIQKLVIMDSVKIKRGWFSHPRLCIEEGPDDFLLEEPSLMGYEGDWWLP